MSLPSLVKTWQYSVNGVVGGTGVGTTDNQSVMVALITALTTFGTLPWTVDYSCDGSTAGTKADGVNRITTNANAVFSNSTASAHSWIVLKQTGVAAGFEMLLDCGTNTSNNGSYCRIAFSYSAGFTGGTTTASPTATDQFWVGGSSGTDVNWLPTASWTGRLHVQQSTDGKSTRWFVCGGSATIQVFLVDAVANATAGWTVPVAALLWGSGLSGTEAVTYTNLCRNARTSGRHSSQNFMMYLTTEGFNSSEGGTQHNFANDITSNYPIFPIGICSITTATTRGRHGTLNDFYGGSTAVSGGSTYPSGGAQFAQFGHFVTPWNGSTPLLA